MIIHYALWLNRVYPDMTRAERVTVIDAFRAVNMPQSELSVLEFAVPAKALLIWARAQLAIMKLYRARERGAMSFRLGFATGVLMTVGFIWLWAVVL